MGIRSRGVALVIGLLALRPRVARPRITTAALSVAVLATVLFADAMAEGKSAYDSPYGYERTWNAALRLVRVDLGLKVLEKDDANGYVLFEYRSSPSEKKTASGSLELIRGSGGSARPDDVRVVAQVPQMPRYHEQVLLDELVQKMRAEYGEPPEPRESHPPDAGADGSEESY
jgi:hypothetical protein